ncbi:hypothetical protein FV233_25255 [Methylobacterium sp. WL7]|nr:hypothetical protein FV233_25255 [Methylobacterium sp. WL7]
MEVLMDMKQSIEIAVFVIAAVALMAAILNLLMRDRRPQVGYTYSGSGEWDGSYGSSNSSSDPGSSSGGHSCSHGGSSGDGGSCGGGDGGGGGGGN